MLLKIQSLYFNCLPHFHKHLSICGILATCSKPNSRTTTASLDLNLEQQIQGPLKVFNMSVDAVLLPLLTKVTPTKSDHSLPFNSTYKKSFCIFVL